MTMHYWAVRPKSMGARAVRIEKAASPRTAVDMAFGRSFPNPKYNVGKWLVKDMGTRLAVIQSDKRRIALLHDADGWYDPYEGV